MIFDSETAKQLEVLIHPTVEKAINLLLDCALKDKESIFDNALATESELRQYQGQKILVAELRQYRARLKDTITREKEQKEDGRLYNRP